MVFEKIREMLATQFDKEADEITMDTDVQEDFNADSIDIVDLLYAIEDEFDVVIPDEEAANMKKVGDLVKYIENNQ
ncbi:MAG: acyl carrier protein [Clostridia bacterium]|nr:acyl carrier protein [Clostridia bacterium]